MLSLGLGLSGGGRLAGWTPRKLGASLAGWYRGDYVSLNGSTVSQWPDISGNARNWTQGTATRQPVWEAAGLGGRPCLHFDGSNDLLAGANYSALITSADIFIVMQLDNDPPTAGFGQCWQICSQVGTEDYVPFYTADRTVYCGLFATGRKTVGTIGAADYFESPRIVSVYSVASSWKFHTDGVERYTTTTNTFTSASTNNAIGGDPESGFNLDGRLAEIIIASPALTSDQRAQVYAYLKKRYGIA